MRALLRTDTSSSIGSGHVARCLTLAGALRAQGVVCTFAMEAPSEKTRAWIAREGHDIIVLSHAADPRELAPYLDTKSESERVQLVIVDGYHFGAAYTGALRGTDRVIAVVDDLASEPIDADAVINGNLYGAELAYAVPRSTMLLTGPTYALVRSEFVAARAARERATSAPNEGPKHVFVTMGGADPRGETERVLAALDALPSPVEVRVAVGPANPRLDQIREASAKSALHHIEVLANVTEMAAHMLWSDVTITAAGGTCLELSCVGVAAVATVVADNQRLVAGALRTHDLMLVVDDTRTIGAATSTLLADPARRQRMESAQRGFLDGGGKERVASALIAALR